VERGNRGNDCLPFKCAAQKKIVAHQFSAAKEENLDRDGDETHGWRLMDEIFSLLAEREKTRNDHSENRRVIQRNRS